MIRHGVERKCSSFNTAAPWQLRKGTPVDENCLHEFVSRIEGKNATVQVFPDRIEWHKTGHFTGHLATGMAELEKSNLGSKIAKASVIRPGPGRKKATEMIPVKSLTSVTTEKDGFRYVKVKVIASGNTIDMRVRQGRGGGDQGHAHSPDARDAPVAGGTELAAPPPTAPADGGAAPDPMEQLKKLAEMRDAGFMSEEEFDAKRREILDRL